MLEHLLADEVASGKVEFRTIEGLTIENRAAQNKAIPDDVLAELRKCHVILKGPTTTPRKGDPWPNIESANVAMRKELDLFANVRPVRVPEQGIDWTFFRENTEDLYALGSDGIKVTDDLAIDFRLITTPGLRAHHPHGLRVRGEEQHQPPDRGHQGQRREDDRRHVPGDGARRCAASSRR